MKTTAAALGLAWAFIASWGIGFTSEDPILGVASMSIALMMLSIGYVIGRREGGAA